MRKLQAIFVLLLLTLTIFSSSNIVFQSASASPPATGDIAWANATASYTEVSKWQQQPTINLKLWATNNSTATGLYIDSGTKWALWDTSARASYSVDLSNYTASGVVNLRTAGQLAFYEGAGEVGTTATYDFNVGTVWANLTASGITYPWSYVFNNYSSSEMKVWIAPEWNVTAGSTVTSLNLTYSPDTADSISSFTHSPSSLFTWEDGSTIYDAANTVVGTLVTASFVYGWSYSYESISSSFSLPSGLISYEINWTAQQRTNATYNSLTQAGATGGHFSGSSSVTSIIFQADFMEISIPDYSISYFLNENTTTPMTSTVLPDLETE